MGNNNVTKEMKINKSCFDIFPQLESERLIYREVNPDDGILAIIKRDYTF